MKKIIRILSLALVLCLLAGCGSAAPKTFTCRELSMEVPVTMRDVSGQSDYAAFTFVLDSSKVAIFGLNETLEEYPVLESYSLKEYTDLTIEANGISTQATERTGEGYYYFDFTANSDGDAYKYLVGCFQSESGFWMIQVCSLATNYDQEAFLGYLDTVTLS